MAYAKPTKPQRVYVKVNSDFDATGYMQPRAIIWEDGRTFRIDAVKDFRPASSIERNLPGDCYTIVIKLCVCTQRCREQQSHCNNCFQ